MSATIKSKNGTARSKRRFFQRKVDALNRRSKSEKILFTIVFVIFAIQTFTMFFVLWWLINNSLKDPFEYAQLKNSLHFPEQMQFGNYIQAFKTLNTCEITFFEMILNSLYYTVVCSFLGSFCPAVTGYVLAKYRFKGRNLIYSIAILTLTLPIVGSGAAYMKLLHNLGLYDNPLFYIVNNFNGFGANFLIYSAFFSGLSWSYAEAAEIDGANPWQIFFKIMFPQALPIYFTYVIICAIACWNEYNLMILYMPSYLSLAAGLYTFQARATRAANYPVYFAGLIVSMIPTLIIFGTFSDKVMTSLSVGGLKG